MTGNDKRKQSLYFPEDMLEEITREAVRLDRSLSWVVQRAWLIASKELGKFPSVQELVAAPQPAPSAAEGWTAQPPPVQPPPEAELRPGTQVLEFLKGKFDSA